MERGTSNHKSSLVGGVFVKKRIETCFSKLTGQLFRNKFRLDMKIEEIAEISGSSEKRL